MTAEETTPWRTLERALDEAVPGDTLVLAAGTWTEPIQVRTSDLTLLGAGSLGDTVLQPGGRELDTVVLACTHYPFLVNRMRKMAPWPVDWLDPAEARAARI